MPPPAAPAPVMPPLQPLAPEPNHGQVSIDADEPSRVDLVTGTTESEYTDADGNIVPYTADVYRSLCAATPCVTSLRFGPRQLRITSNLDPTHSGTGTVAVGAQPTDYRFALGHNHSPPIGPGVGVMLGGVVALFAGSFTAAFTSTPSALSTANYAEIGVGCAGAVALTVGLWMILRSALGGTVQDGTGVQWTPAP